MASGRIISREEAAIMLDVSVHELRRRQKANQIKVIKRGTRNQVFYDYDVIETLRIKREENADPASLASNTVAMAAFSTEDAVRVFGELAKGATLVQCVERLSIHPSKVKAIVFAYEELSDTVVLDSLTIRAINELPLDGTFPITKAEDALELLKECAKGSPCALCRKNARHVCKACAIPYVHRQLSREAKAEKTEKAEKPASGELPASDD